MIVFCEFFLEEIEEICEKCLNIEIEVFVYGVLCMVYFGCCLLFGYINKCDLN